jgi:DNA repair ATPase RecN
MQNDPIEHFIRIQATFSKLIQAVEKAEKSNTALPDCFVLAQTLENQKEYYKELYAENQTQMSQMHELEQEIKKTYEKLFPIYDRTSDFEIIELLYRSLEILIESYQEKFGVIGEMTNEQIIEMLEVRDKIKILFDELEVWLDKFEEKEQLSFERKSHIFEKLKQFDKELRNELIVHNQLHVPIYEEAERRLIKEPNGVERFNFWWWHAGR